MKISLRIKCANGLTKEENENYIHRAMRRILINLPIILEKDARVLNGACGVSSIPLNSWMRFSASRNKLFKWLPNESGDLTKYELHIEKTIKQNGRNIQLHGNWYENRDLKKSTNVNVMQWQWNIHTFISLYRTVL